MPDQTVEVIFSPTADPQFMFEPGKVIMTAAAKVIFQKRPGSAAWKFKDAHVKNDTLKEFSATVQGNGSSLHVDDKFYDKEKTPYGYNVTVELNGTTYRSPDPVIVNDPGGSAGP